MERKKDGSIFAELSEDKRTEIYLDFIQAEKEEKKAYALALEKASMKHHISKQLLESIITEYREKKK